MIKGRISKSLPGWYRHGESANVTFEQAWELFNSGSNVMLYHGKDNVIGLYVDDKRFGQR